ncbi:MAG TPA: hypothetical protein VE175_07565 [Woeseiaceae bacterium]|jgi:hypothetical protein|nr:hypothetical protein [Woeseiaceae bacterium]
MTIAAPRVLRVRIGLGIAAFLSMILLYALMVSKYGVSTVLVDLAMVWTDSSRRREAALKRFTKSFFRGLPVLLR